MKKLSDYTSALALIALITFPAVMAYRTFDADNDFSRLLPYGLDRHGYECYAPPLRGYMDSEQDFQQKE